MRFVVAPDSFKESLTSVEAAAAMAAGIHDVDPVSYTHLTLPTILRV